MSGSTQSSQALIVTIGGCAYVCAMTDIVCIQEDIRQVVKVPGLPAWVLGCTKLNGKMRAIINLEGMFDSDKPLAEICNHVVFARTLSMEVLGVCVDSVDAFIRIEDMRLWSGPENENPLSEITTAIVEVDGKPYPLLDFEKLPQKYERIWKEG